jgi:hypothetical protein
MPRQVSMIGPIPDNRMSRVSPMPRQSPLIKVTAPEYGSSLATQTWHLLRPILTPEAPITIVTTTRGLSLQRTTVYPNLPFSLRNSQAVDAERLTHFQHLLCNPKI